MFDVGFWELCLVGLVSLLVIGPEKLPQVARVAGFWIGKGRRIVASLKTEIKEELHAEELRQMLQDQSELEELQDLLEEGRDATDKVQSSLNSFTDELKKTHDSK